MLFCLHVEFVFMLMSFNSLTDDLLKDNPPSKLRLSISAAQICLFCEKYENPGNLGIVGACADKSHLCSQCLGGEKGLCRGQPFYTAFQVQCIV